jgi:hypothetical protein
MGFDAVATLNLLIKRDRSNEQLEKRVEENFTSALTMRERVLRFLLIAFFAILPVAQTTALRNILFVLAIALSAYLLIRSTSHVRERLSTLRSKLPVVFYLWVAFLFLFPLFAAEPAVAWKSLRSDWAPCVIAWLLGFSAVLILGDRGPSLRTLIWASSFPVILHLLLCALAWFGLLGHTLPEHMTLSQISQALLLLFTADGGANWQWQPFPWGFRGFDPMHGNLGYAACQTMALLVANAYQLHEKRSAFPWWVVLLGIPVCFVSVLIASSRGAVLFGLALMIIALLVWVYSSCKQVVRSRPKRAATAVPLPVALLSIFVVVSVLGFAGSRIIEKDSRWTTMVDRIRSGFWVDEPIAFLCNGLTAPLEQKIRNELVNRSTDYQDQVIYGLKVQDGGRIVLMRAAIGLSFEYPWGLDGSRETYQKLIAKHCGHAPAYQYSHAHQAWLDMALGLGWVGVLLFASVLSTLAWLGWRAFFGEVKVAHGDLRCS